MNERLTRITTPSGSLLSPILMSTVQAKLGEGYITIMPTRRTKLRRRKSEERSPTCPDCGRRMTRAVDAQRNTELVFCQHCKVLSYEIPTTESNAVAKLSRAAQKLADTCNADAATA